MPNAIKKKKKKVEQDHGVDGMGTNIKQEISSGEAAVKQRQVVKLGGEGRRSWERASRQKEQLV